MSRLRRAADHPYFDNGGMPLAFAHRGGSLTGDNIGLENSMVAFEAAISMGYRYIETDVHATSDDVLLAFHDSSLDRTTNGAGVISQLPYAEVQRAKIDGREPIPLLSEVLTSWPELRLNIDAKSAGALVPLAETIRQHDAWDRVCVASFSPVRLHQLRRLLAPRVASSFAAFGVASLRFLPTRILRGQAVATGQAAQVPVRRHGIEIVTREFVERAHELGKHVHVWTVDFPAEMDRLLDLGVDGIMTDRLDLLRDVYHRRGLWREQPT